jgi:Domain of unknown function (DUF4306)
MKHKLLLISISILLLGMSTLFAWYEGSEILDLPSRWENNAIISKLMNNGEINSVSQVNQLDFFVYAIKFQPLFPILMTFFFFSTIFLILYPFFGKISFLSVIIIYSLFLFLTILITPIEEGTILFERSLLVLSLLFISLVTLSYIVKKRLYEKKDQITS